MRPDIYPTDHHQERLQREADEREKHDVDTTPGWYVCPQCGEMPVIGVAGRLPVCSECQDPDPIEEPS